jgi:hypothetical protein
MYSEAIRNNMNELRIREQRGALTEILLLLRQIRRKPFPQQLTLMFSVSGLSCRCHAAKNVFRCFFRRGRQPSQKFLRHTFPLTFRCESLIQGNCYYEINFRKIKNPVVFLCQ